LKIRVPRAYYNKKDEAIKAIKDALLKKGVTIDDLDKLFTQLAD